MEEAPVANGNAGTLTYGSATADCRKVEKKNCEANGKIGKGYTTGWRRFLSGKDYRKKICITLSVYLDYFAFAWLYGIVGPSLPDLQEIVRVDLQTASWIFTCFALGYVIGCPFHGFLYGKFNNVLLMTIFAIASGGLWIATPWCEELWLMLLVRFMGGIAWGGTDSACHSQLFAIWASEATVWVQLLYLIFGLGGTGSSYVITYFVGTHLTTYDISDANITLASRTFTDDILNSTSGLNESSTVLTPQLSSVVTRIQWAYIIAGAVSIFAAIPSLVEYVSRNCCAYRQVVVTQSPCTGTKVTERKRKDPSIGIVAIIIILMVANATMAGMIDTYSGFLATFTIRQLKWTKQKGAFAVTLFFLAHTVGNVVSAVSTLILGFRARTLLLSSLLGTALSSIGLTVCSLFSFHAGAWFFNVAVGITISPLWPSFFTYVEDKVVSIAGKVGAALLGAGAFGMFITPIIIGYTMDNLSPISFTYAMLIECAVIFGCFLTVFYVYRERTDMDTTF